MNTLKLASAILGENYNVLIRSSVRAQQKIRGQFGILLIPVILWLGGGYGVAYSLIGLGFWSSLLFGCAAAYVILKVDLAFMQLSSKRMWSGSNIFRLGIVLLGCTINSLLVDSILFQQDYIDIANRMKMEEVNRTYEVRTHDLRKQLDDLNTVKTNCQNERDHYLAAYMLEMDGKGESGQLGLGNIAKAKQAAYQQAQSRLDQVSNEFNQKESELLTMQNETLQNSTPGLYTKIQALVEHTFFSGEWLSKIIWLVMFLFVVMLEYSPIVFKNRMEATDYDVWKATDELTKKRSMEMEAERVRRAYERLSNYSAADWRVVEKMKAA